MVQNNTPIPLHLQKAYAYLGYREGDLPVTEEVCEEIFSIPIYPEMSGEHVRFVIRTLVAFKEREL